MKERNLEENLEENTKESQKKNFKLYQLFWYLVIFSIIGLIIETIYCFATTGVWESRKGLLLGPFCPVYGVGATILIVLLSRFQKRPFVLFVSGAVLGNVIEYLLSYLLEAIYGMRFWDYFYLNFNLNGRICVLYSIFWGILAIALVLLIKPWIDTLIDRINTALSSKVQIILFIILLLDTLLTVWGVISYENRARASYHNLPEKPKGQLVQNIEQNLFPNEKMQKTFPNLRFRTNQGEEIWIKDVLSPSLE